MRNICLNNIGYKDNSFLGYTTYQAKAITIPYAFIKWDN